MVVLMGVLVDVLILGLESCAAVGGDQPEKKSQRHQVTNHASRA